jgi:hypothetical protein
VSPNEPYVPGGATNAQVGASSSGGARLLRPLPYTTFRLADVRRRRRGLTAGAAFATSGGATTFAGNFLTFFSYKNVSWSVPMNFISIDDRNGVNTAAGPEYRPDLGVFGTPWFLPSTTDITTATSAATVGTIIRGRRPAEAYADATGTSTRSSTLPTVVASASGPQGYD